MAKRGRKTHRNTEGRRLLIAYLESNSQASLGLALSVGQQTISAWKRGACRPEPHHRDALARVANIRADAWYSSSELAVSKGPDESGEHPVSGSRKTG